MASRPWRYLAGLVAVAAGYFAAAKLGLSLAFLAEQVTVVWPASGIALAVLLLFGYRYWPGIALGAFVVNWMTHEPVGVALGIATGNTLEAVLGAWLLRKGVGFANSLDRLRDVLALLVLAAGVSTTVSATIGVTSLCLGGVQSWADFAPLWWLWWLGDATGDLIVAPVLLTWGAAPLGNWRPRRAAEAIALLVGLTVVGVVIFGGPPPARSNPLAYTIFPFVVWAAVRFEQRGVATVVLSALVIAVLGTVNGLGPFAGGTLAESLIHLHLYMAIVAVTALCLGAVVAERRMAERRRAVGYAATAVLVDAPSLPEAAPQLLRVIAESLQWDVGALWSVDRQEKVLRCVEVWHGARAKTEEFAAATRGRTFGPWTGLPGRVWSSGQPIWVADVTGDVNFPRSAVASRAGLHGALAVPILLGPEVLGVIEFFSRQIRQPDADLLNMLASIGGQVGLYVERRRLEQELRDRADQLAEAHRRKDEFLAMLAHELRNPLAPIRNALHILKMPAADAATVAQAKEMMGRQVQNLMRLVDDLLDVSRIMRGKIELRKERIDLAESIGRAVETASPVVQQGRHELTVSLPPEPIRVEADSVRLAQAIANLLHNAAKYTEPGGIIVLSAERDGGDAVVRVRDSGIGIGPEMLPRIFGLFVQADRALTRAQGGMGIGLTLVRTLVELHGGRVQAFSEGLGKGSEFVIRLPTLAVRAPEPSLDGPTSRGSSGRPPRRRVLVVDDNVDAAESLAAVLRLAGQDVRVSHDGAAALDAAGADRPDVVFLDIGMPGMDGYEVARNMRRDPALRDVVLIALTGWGQEEDRRRSREAGFDHHIVKPVEPDALQRLLVTSGAKSGTITSANPRLAQTGTSAVAGADSRTPRDPPP
jgi:signal transduction histidine kinase/integral membrane sensor domain MASE1/AmiR/NasT family two-component response regulator